MKVIKSGGLKGLVFTTKCPFCGCEFEYNRTDVIEFIIKNRSIVGCSVKCPECNTIFSGGYKDIESIRGRLPPIPEIKEYGIIYVDGEAAVITEYIGVVDEIESYIRGIISRIVSSEVIKLYKDDVEEIETKLNFNIINKHYPFDNKFSFKVFIYNKYKDHKDGIYRTIEDRLDKIERRHYEQYP